MPLALFVLACPREFCKTESVHSRRERQRKAKTAANAVVGEGGGGTRWLGCPGRIQQVGTRHDSRTVARMDSLRLLYLARLAAIRVETWQAGARATATREVSFQEFGLQKSDFRKVQDVISKGAQAQCSAAHDSCSSASHHLKDHTLLQYELQVPTYNSS